MANTYLYNLQDIWNDANITFNSIRMVVADVASQTDSTFLKFAISTNTNVRFAVFKTGFFDSGNTVANLQANATLLKLANSTATANFGLSGISLGAVTDAFLAGNSTVNVVANSTILKLANSTSVMNLTSASLLIGANVSLNTSVLFIGNSTVNSFMNSSTLIFGGNLSITNTDLMVGNSSVNSQVNSSLLRTTGTLQFGTRVANTTATITGTIDVMDAGGATRKLMVCG